MTLSAPELENASNKLEFHVNVYVKTYRWLKNKEAWEDTSIPSKMIYSFSFLPRSLQWTLPRKTRNLVLNTFEDSNLMHARILYEFLARDKEGRFRETDVRASDFYELESDYELLVNQDLKELSDSIGVRSFHLTTKHLTVKISDLEWRFDDIARQLLQPLRKFFTDDKASKLNEAHPKQCLDWLELLESLIS